MSWSGAFLKWQFFHTISVRFTRREELLVWEDKMVRAGHLDLVRHEQLVEPPPPKPKVIKRRKAQAAAAPTESGAAGVQ